VGIAEDRAGRWRVTVCGLGVVTIVAYGVAYYSYGVLIDPIRTSTGWSSPALGAVFSGVLVIGGAGALVGGRLVDRLGTRPGFVFAGTVGAGAVAASSYQHDLPAFAVLYAVGCGVITALGFYNITQPAAIRAAGDEPARAVVWLTVIGAFSSPIFLPVTAALVDGLGWRATIRVLAAIAAATFLTMAAVQGVEPAHVRARRAVVSVPDALRNAWEAPGFPRWVLASLISGAGVDIILVYQVPVMIAAGLPIGAAATIGGIRGFAQLAGRLPLSPLLRRLGARRTIVLSLIVAAVGTLLLLASAHVATAVLYSLLAGASIGAMYTLQGIYTNELVGGANLSMLMGVQAAVLLSVARPARRSPGPCLAPPAPTSRWCG
jgi:MFS family permease